MRDSWFRGALLSVLFFFLLVGSGLTMVAAVHTHGGITPGSGGVAGANDPGRHNPNGNPESLATERHDRTHGKNGQGGRPACGGHFRIGWANPNGPCWDYRDAALQPVAKVALHSSGHASRPASLLLGHIWPDMLPYSTLPDGRLTALGATRTFATGCKAMCNYFNNYAYDEWATAGYLGFRWWRAVRTMGVFITRTNIMTAGSYALLLATCASGVHGNGG